MYVKIKALENPTPVFHRGRWRGMSSLQEPHGHTGRIHPENPSDDKAHRPEQTYRLVFQNADLLFL